MLCVGAGGLGSSALMYLAGSGIGHIGILDGDKVELSNLHRQVIFTEQDLGQYKAQVAKNRLDLQNSDISMEAINTFLTERQALSIIEKYDFILDCTDNFATRYLINDACTTLNKPFVTAAIQEYEGQLQLIEPSKTACYRCTYLSPPPSSLAPSCAENGVLPILPGMLGLFQATECIKYLVGLYPTVPSRILLFDALSLQLESFTTRINPACPICGLHRPFNEVARPQFTCGNEIEIFDLEDYLAKEDVMLIDVRTPEEHEHFNIGGTNIPLNHLEAAFSKLPKDKQLILYCAKGIRSKVAMELLFEMGFKDILSVKDGLIHLSK